MTELMAAPRDASWYARPDVRRTKVCHIDTGDRMASCNPRCLPLDETMAMPAREVPDGGRCQRPGCRHLWPVEKGEAGA